jgi:hypothetical protein
VGCRNTISLQISTPASDRLRRHTLP